ncbi:hypothetical protein KY289_000994 [Solanum tuberosum]|nr:hypothetical protein KY289_000994 [Solanum tuberosum]
MDAKLWQFRGENPESWIVQAEHYFNFYKIEEDQKLIVVLHYLDGEALRWYQWLFRNNQFSNWPQFIDKVRIHFKQKEYESAARRFVNLRQVTYVAEYQNGCEDILSSFGDSDVLFSGHTCVHPQWSNITNSFFPHYEKSECKSNTNVRKVFDELSDRYEDSNPFGTSSKLVELSLSSNDLVNYVSRLVVINGCNDDAKNGERNDEEEIGTIKDEPIEFVIAIADKPSLYTNSTVTIPCDLAMFDIHKVLDNHLNQLIGGYFGKAYPMRLTQRWEEINSIPSTCSYVKRIDRVWDPGRHLLVNSYVSKMIENNIVGVDISDILLPADKGDTNDPLVEGSNRSWFYLHPTTHDLMLVPLEHLSSYFTITGGQTLFIEFSIGYSCNASKGLYIAGEVHLLVLYASFDVKQEAYVEYFKKTLVRPYVFCKVLGYCIQFVLARDLISCSSNVKDREKEPFCMNDDQQSSHKSLFLRNISIVYFYYVVGSAKRNDSAFFLLASTELVFTKKFLIEKDFHVLPVKSRENYIADVLLMSAPNADVDETAKHDLANDSKLAWTCHTLLYVHQCDCCYKVALTYETNCSTPWSPLSFIICMHNEWCVAVCYLEKTWVKLPCPSADVSMSFNLTEQMIVPRIGFRTVESFSLSTRLNNAPIQANMEMLVIPGSSSLLGTCYMPPEIMVENQQVPLPSIPYHMARNSHKTYVLVLNYFEKLFYKNVIFPSLVCLYSNLKDKVLFEGESIVVNQADLVRAYGLLETFIWDPGPISISIKKD